MAERLGNPRRREQARGGGVSLNVAQFPKVPSFPRKREFDLNNVEFERRLDPRLRGDDDLIEAEHPSVTPLPLRERDAQSYRGKSSWLD